jgi:transposase
MVDLGREHDIEMLRQAALLLEAENKRLHTRLLELTKKLAVAEGRAATQLELEIIRLKEQLEQRTREIYGAKSEKRSRADSGQGKQDDAEPRRGHGPRPQLELPVVEQTHQLDEPDRMCPKCGGELGEWNDQYEQSEEIDVVERSFRLVRHKRQKYRCECGCIETALGPPKLSAGGRYSVDFAIDVAISKYADHLPLARQVKIMKREGLKADTQTLWDQLWALASHLKPTYEALHTEVLAHAVVGADETTWRLMENGKGKKGSAKWWAWALSCEEAVYYEIQSSRSAEAAARVLKDYRGVVVADGYSAYKSLRTQATKHPQLSTGHFTLAACWAHARRRFVEAEPNYPEATEVLDMIGDLYDVEKKVRAGPGRPDLEVLTQLRQTESKKIADSIKEWLKDKQPRVLPQSALGKAISYALEMWPGLIVFLSDARVPLDNNQTERSIRGVTVGRKNHYGSRSLRGTEVAALFYSLIESAKLAAVEPRAYLREATLRAIADPGTITLPQPHAQSTTHA